MPSLKVMTWNLENLCDAGSPCGPKTPEQYQQKLNSLAAVILRLDPDVLAVQEVGSTAAVNDLMGLLRGRYPHLELSSHPDRRGIRVGFLSKFVIEETEDILVFPQTGLPAVPGLDEDGNLIDVTRLGRGALRIRVSPHPGFPVHLVTAHLKSKLLTYPSSTEGPRFTPKNENERSRVAGLALLKRTAEAVALRVKANELLEGNAHTALIVLGDMNDVTTAVTTQILQGPTGSEIDTDAFNRPDQGDDTRLFNLAVLIPADRRFSRIHNGVRELLDHILVSQELLPGLPRQLPSVDSCVNGSLPSIGDDPNARRDDLGSDHAPIIATFAI